MSEYLYLPITIQAEILKRLPLKPLLRFRSVSKPWKRLIDSPYFIAFYGVRHPRPHRLILRYESEVIHEHAYYSFVDEDDSWYEDYGFIEFGRTCIPVPYLVEGRECYPFVVGSSHGLLCFQKITYEDHTDPSNITEMVVLWNPSIRKYVCIPVPDSPNYNNTDYWNANSDYFNYYGDDDVIGFGVCPVTFDPTILKIKRIDHKGETPAISLPWRVRVFTLSTGTWSILSTNLPRESIRLRGSQVAVNGFIYWIAFDMLDAEDGRSQSQFLIMSFDLTAKEFKEINLTGSLTNRLCSIQTISKLHESLVLLEYHRDSEEGVPVCCLWMMKNQGSNRLFTKLYNINVPHAKVMTLLGFGKTGELILVTKQQERYNADLEIYDPNSEAIDNLGHDGYGYSFFMCSYMESLLLLDQLDGFIYSISI